jgi:hypothetical protein
MVSSDRMRWAAVVMIIALLGTSIAWVSSGTVDPETAPTDTFGFVRHFIRLGIAGHGPGGPSTAQPNSLSVADLRLGDVLVCRNPGSVYGHWSHATIYLGDGVVLGQDILAGIFLENATDLEWYDDIRVYRPTADDATRQQVVTFARSLVGKPFHLAAHPRDPRQWSCAKIVIHAWALAQVSLSDDRFWQTPDAIVAGPQPLWQRFSR